MRRCDMYLLKLKQLIRFFLDQIGRNAMLKTTEFHHRKQTDLLQAQHKILAELSEVHWPSVYQLQSVTLQLLNGLYDHICVNLGSPGRK